MYIDYKQGAIIKPGDSISLKSSNFNTYINLIVILEDMAKLDFQIFRNKNS